MTYAKTWVCLKDIMLSETSSSEKDDGSNYISYLQSSSSYWQKIEGRPQELREKKLPFHVYKVLCLARRKNLEMMVLIFQSMNVFNDTDLYIMYTTVHDSELSEMEKVVFVACYFEVGSFLRCYLCSLLGQRLSWTFAFWLLTKCHHYVIIYLKSYHII